ncbi:hypothetical protein N7463_005232 [Penicillium fimorum]|uniref:Uncharacterized protein n=1 Tax=Penicillium fimorum TaxID=1882269 RepID=A0A9W9XS66_9EURO|nr:hypothetical protein N7463_005232 [Penicillium fimorum]
MHEHKHIETYYAPPFFGGYWSRGNDVSPNGREKLSGAPLPSYGAITAVTAGGNIQVDNVVVQANILVDGQPMLPRWTDFLVGFSAVWCLDSPYACLSTPDNTGRMHLGNNLAEILGNVPPCNPALAIPAPTSLQGAHPV